MRWASRPLLLSAIAFWWGGVVLPQLVSLAFPELLPPSAVPDHLDPDSEGTIVNVVAAGALLTVTVLALANAVVSRRQAAGWMTAGGWTLLAATSAFLAWEELSDFHVVGVAPIRRALFGEEVYFTLGPNLWVVLASPLIAAFALTMGVFAHKGLRTREVRAPFVFGLAAWLLAVVHEVSYPFLFNDRAGELAIVLEETLEFGGTLLIVASAAIALGQSRCAAQVFASRRLGMLLGGSLAAVGVLGGLIIACVFRAPVVDARAETHIGAFHIGLSDQEAVAQEFRMPAVPIGRFMLRIVNQDSQARPATVKLRITDAGHSEPVIRESQVDVPAGEGTQWAYIDFPSLALPEGQLLTAQLAADIAPNAQLGIVGTKTSRHDGDSGQLLINGELAWPDQDIEFMLYGAPEPTLSKLQALWHTLASDWRWPILGLDLALALTFVAFIPAVLVALAQPRLRCWLGARFQSEN